MFSPYPADKVILLHSNLALRSAQITPTRPPPNPSDLGEVPTAGGDSIWIWGGCPKGKGRADFPSQHSRTILPNALTCIPPSTTSPKRHSLPNYHQSKQNFRAQIHCSKWINSDSVKSMSAAARFSAWCCGLNDIGMVMTRG